MSYEARWPGAVSASASAWRRGRCTPFTGLAPIDRLHGAAVRHKDHVVGTIQPTAFQLTNVAAVVLLTVNWPLIQTITWSLALSRMALHSDQQAGSVCCQSSRQAGRSL
jgi:hypothetical protein